jgi:putative hydrolase of the HAD superfamily
VDAADTLLELAEPPALTYRAHAAAHGIEIALPELQLRLRGALAEFTPPSGADLAALPGLERENWRAVVAAALGERAARGPCFDALHEHYAQPSAWRLVQGARAALQCARALGLRLAIVSNMDARLPALLRGHQLDEFFACVAIPSSCGHAKPDPRIFGWALQRLGCAPGRALYIGDRWTRCVQAALGAGLHALQLEAPDAAPREGALAGWGALEDVLHKLA